MRVDRGAHRRDGGLQVLAHGLIRRFCKRGLQVSHGLRQSLHFIPVVVAWSVLEFLRAYVALAPPAAAEERGQARQLVVGVAQGQTKV